MMHLLTWVDHLIKAAARKHQATIPEGHHQAAQMYRRMLQSDSFPVIPNSNKQTNNRKLKTTQVSCWRYFTQLFVGYTDHYVTAIEYYITCFTEL